MPIQISEIVDNFNDRNCVILLGPRLAKNKQGEPLHARLIDHLKEKGLSVEEDIDRLYSCDPKTKTRIYGYLKQYYRDSGVPSNVYKQLSLVPCHLYLSIVPDGFLTQAFAENNLPCEFKYYVKDQPADEISKPSLESPVVYNLFGSIDSQKSLILTHEDLIQYLFSVIQEFRLPQNLRDAVKNATYFVFLGFDFDKWYLKLWLRLLLGFDETKNSIAAENGSSTDDRLLAFFRGQYGFEFVETGIEEYVNHLHDECRKRGVLRTVKQRAAPSVQDEIKNLIKQDEVEIAMERLGDFLSTTVGVAAPEAEGKQQALDDLYAQMGRWEGNKKALRRKTISEEAAGVEKNRIIEWLLTTTSEVFA